jgi:hypothetical protein
MATLTTTFDNTTSRVLLSATSLPTTADVAKFEVSTDNVHWFTVRGGAAVTITANAASLYDYEFSAGLLNYYRVSAIDTDPPTFVAAGTAVTAVGVTVTPGLPAGYAEGDLLVIWAAIRNSGTGTVVCPTGWTVLLQTDNIGLFGKRSGVAGSESAPNVTVTGGVTGAAGSDVIAQMAAFRNLDLVTAASAYHLNPSAQNIFYPGLSGFQPTWVAALILGWKQLSWSSVATVTGATAEIAEPVSTAGADAGLVWDYVLMSTPAPVASGVFTVTGGSAAISYGAAVAFTTAGYVARATATITPLMTACWLKFVAAPYMNRAVTLIDWAESERVTRTTAYPVVGKYRAGVVTDLHSPRNITVSLWADSDAEVAGLDLALSVGNIALLHIPPNVALKSMYAMVGTHKYERPAHLSHRAKFTVPLTEVSAPDPSIVGSIVTWATLITLYGSWADVIAANATWAAVLALTGSPADALVGR